MRRAAVLRVAAPAAVLAFLLVACWAPYYDPAVSASVGFADKLGDPLLSFGPIGGSGTFNSKDGLEFLPTRPAGSPWAPVDGFMIQKTEEGASIAFVERSGGSYGFASSSQGMNNDFGTGALLRSEAADASGNPQMIAITDHQQVRQYNYDRSTKSLNQSSVSPSSTSCTQVYAAGAVLYDGANDADRYSMLFTDGSKTLLSADLVGKTLGSFTDQFAATLATGGLALSSGNSALADAGGDYLYYSASGGPTLRWDTASLPSTAPTELSVTERIIAVLSDGTLVSQDDLHLRAYTASGTRIFTALAGSIRLEHEVYCPGPSPAAGYYVLFSQVLCSGSGSSDNSEYYVKVWRCSLSGFKKLGD
jgi:hypothetical protein